MISAQQRFGIANFQQALNTSVGAGSDGSFIPMVFDMALQPDGRVVLAGKFTSWNGTLKNRLARINSDATLDTSFVADPNHTVYAVALQPDGKILIGGGFTRYTGSVINRIARLNSNGTLDTGFNPGTGADGIVYDIALQSDGKILIGGAFATVNGTAHSRIARLNADGSLDTGFTATADNTVSTISVQADRQILLGGSFLTVNGSSQNRIARLNRDGSLDSTFNAGSGANDSVNTFALQSDGMLLVGGAFTSFNGATANYLTRLHTGDVDNDGIENGADYDNDNDNDGVPDSIDAFPLNPAEWLDTDNDGIGDNADLDDDGDGVPDYIDADPLSPAITHERTLLLQGPYKGSWVSEGVSP